jgi:glycosyltransferase involved in cell wall biosynthesis
MRHPLVSIITPSFQQARYIKETVESVLTQDYPNLEYIVVDGGSKDDTCSILQKYSKRDRRLRWVSEKDRGQAHAVNKGIAMAKGEIIGWLNSDDTYEPRAVRRAVKAFLRNPELGMIYGKGNYIDENSRILRPYVVEHFNKEKLFASCYICQPAAFFKKIVFDKVGPLDESFNFCMDFELWMRISKWFSMGHVEHLIANSRLHAECKSVTQYVEVGLPEIIRASMNHYGSVSNEWIMQVIVHHIGRGPAGLIKYFKELNTFGSSLTLDILNREHDSWVPPHWQIKIDTPKKHELHSMVIQGAHNIPHLINRPHNQVFSIYANNQYMRDVEMGSGPFCIHFPLHHLPHSERLTLDFHSRESFIPVQHGINSDNRNLSTLIYEAVALSAEEMQIFNIVNHDQNLDNIKERLWKHRRSSPCFI